MVAVPSTPRPALAPARARHPAETNADIRAITGRMNDTARACLGWMTPAEVFADEMEEVTGRRSDLRGQHGSHFE